MNASDADGDGLERFGAATAAWFRGAFDAPTRVQREAWAAIGAGGHALVVAPTGSGKTLAAFLWALDRLATERAAQADPTLPGLSSATAEDPGRARKTSASERAGRTRILYISPLKALGVDVERNLRAPLIGIRQTARRLDLDVPELRVGVRTGDTPPAERRRLLAHPPDVLITTPESLFLMLTGSARSALSGVETVIVDEVHAVAGSKRGAHLALSLERLDARLERPAQRIGLSATVRPLDAVARFLGGAAPVTVVAPPSTKAFDLNIVVPVEDMSDVGIAAASEPPDAPDDGPLFGDASQAISAGDTRRAGSIWPFIEQRVLAQVLAHRSTIVFVNSRGLAERFTARLNEAYAREQVSGDDDGGEGGDPRGLGIATAAAAVVPGMRLKNAQMIGLSGEYEGAAADIARAHHGSLSKDMRAEVEESLKSGTLRCVVATSSLELGIDMGDVDLVIQIESPPSVASGVQRLGRAGHQVGEVSSGTMYPKHRADLLHSAVVAGRMLDGSIEKLHLVRHPLDVLAQQTVAAAAVDRWSVPDWLELVRRASPFADVPESLLLAVLDLLAGKYPSDEFAQLRPRIVWNRDENWFEGRPGAQRLAVVSGGTIPDRGMFGVFLATGDEPGTPEADDGTLASTGRSSRGGIRVGELDEEMVYESRVGDVIALGSTSWRIREIGPDRVRVSPAGGEPGRLAFWRGDGIGRPAELGAAIGAAAREITARLDRAETPEDALSPALAPLLDQWARSNLVSYLSEQRDATGHVPSDRTLVVERTRDELGDWRVILHSPYGRPVHAPWALLVTERVRDRFGMEASAIATDDGIVVRIPDIDADPPGSDLFLFDAEEIEGAVTREVGSSALFAARFRENAARALLLPRMHPGKRSPLWQQRLRASQLLEVARRYPDFPMILETVREVLHDVYDLDAFGGILRSIARREIAMVDVTTEDASPFARSILFGYVGEFMYEGDQPLAERRAAALSLDPQLLADLLGATSLRELLSPDAIAQVTDELQRRAPGFRARGLEGAADLLRLLGPLSASQLAERLDPVLSADRAGDAGPADSAVVAAPADAAVAPAATVGPTDPSFTAIPSQLEPEPEPEPQPEPVPVPVPQPEHAREAEAEEIGRALVADKRALRIRLGGEMRYAAIEDAGRLRDATGVPLPIGVPLAFIEPVADPLGDLVGRYARTHPPFTVEEAARALDLGAAVVNDTLHRLELAKRVTQGEFTPGRSGVEWVDSGVLRRIRARTLAALRGSIEAVPQAAFARFLPLWQHVGGDLRGVDGLVTVIDQLQGAIAPASAWESLILPARIPDYRPEMLDELLATGELRWHGHGSLGSADGWMSLHLTDTESLTLPAAAEPPELTPRAARVLDVLRSGGAMFVADVAQRLSETSAGAPEDYTAVTEALWELAWAGLVTNDSYRPVRATIGGTAHSSAAHRAARRPGRGRMYLGSRRSALGLAGEVAPAVTPPRGAGRWSIAATGTPDATIRAQALGDTLLDRYGIVTRGTVDALDIDGGFSGVYRVLSEFERAGRARRGYLVEGLGGAQFAGAGAVDRLRALADDAQRRPDAPPVALTLAATDPANPYGAALDWPAHPSRHRPGRKAGAMVVLVDGALALYVERGGATLLDFTGVSSNRTGTDAGQSSTDGGGSPEAIARVAARSLADAVIRGGIPHLVIGKIDGDYALDHTLSTVFQEAGFAPSPRGLKLREPSGVRGPRARG